LFDIRNKEVWGWTVGLIAISAFFQAGDTATFFFHRNAFIHNIWWQWITPSLVHLNWMHWLLNVLNLIALVVLFSDSLKGAIFPLIFLGGSLVLMLALYWFSTDVEYYAGMSGVLYGVGIYAAIATFRAMPWISGIVIGYLILKLLAHDWINHFMAVDKALSDVPVVEAIHWYGAGWGVVFFVIFKYYSQKLHLTH
jgi:rhomboid family GlyGly-CTERM serine protease